MLKAQSKTGVKILLEAMSHGKVHLARFVLDALDGDIVDAKTPLIASILLPEGHTRCKFAELLLQRGAGVNRQDGNGRTALSYACESGHLDAVKILVQNSADPEVVDVWGNTALMYAAVAGHAPVVAFLVRAFKRLGLRIDRRNHVGNSAAKVAHFLGHAECVCALRSALRKSSLVERDNVGSLVGKVDLIETNCQGKLQIAPNSLLQQMLLKQQSAPPSVGSLEESEAEIDASCSPTQELDASGVPSPEPAQSLKAPDDNLPRPTPNREAQQQLAFSPRPNGDTFDLGAPSPLSILMTPIGEKDEQITETPDRGVGTFHDGYHQKRSSLPTSLPSPVPPERTPEPVRKSKPVKQREARLCQDGAARGVAHTATATASTAAFSALSDKLFRRFTSPEFRKHGRVLEEEPAAAPGRMARSETFPRDMTRPRVGGQPSVDSVSSVVCEFDFHLKSKRF